MKPATKQPAAAPVLIDVPLKLTASQIEQLSGAAESNGCTIGELVYALATIQLRTLCDDDCIHGALMEGLWKYSSGRFTPPIDREWLNRGFRENDVEAQRDFKIEVGG